MSESDAAIEARLDELEARLRAVERQTGISTDAASIDHVQQAFEDIQQREFFNSSPTPRQVILDEIGHYERAYGDAAPTDYVIEEVATQDAHDTDDVADTIDELLREGSIYEPLDGHLRVV